MQRHEINKYMKKCVKFLVITNMTRCRPSLSYVLPFSIEIDVFRYLLSKSILTVSNDHVITCLCERMPQYRLLMAKPPVTHRSTGTFLLELSSNVGSFQLVCLCDSIPRSYVLCLLVGWEGQGYYACNEQCCQFVFGIVV